MLTTTSSTIYRQTTLKLSIFIRSSRIWDFLAQKVYGGGSLTNMKKELMHPPVITESMLAENKGFLLEKKSEGNVVLSEMRVSMSYNSFDINF